MKGRCECGGVAFEMNEIRPDVTVCHCSQCRRFSGHVWASTYVTKENMTFTSDETLAWYASSDFARRGFCSRCGSSLFYQLNDETGFGVSAGCIDAPTGMSTSKHIFVADKGDYYPTPTDAPVLDQH
ncbi:MAG: GFA family protein [Boseongicola sp.]|nr:GFA family protein [Boseongicola sp.]MDD9978666.1 GFA family protein [Boseongicola sp.]